jgi:hypothetical protein
MDFFCIMQNNFISNYTYQTSFIIWVLNNMLEFY